MKGQRRQGADWRTRDPGEERVLGRDCPLVPLFICPAAWPGLGHIYLSWTSHHCGLEMGKGRGSNVTCSGSDKDICGLVAVLWSIVSFILAIL